MTRNSPPLLDAHIHLFRGGYRTTYGLAWDERDELALYQSFREVHGIEKALVAGFEGTAQYAGNNRDLRQWAAGHDWIAPLAYLHPADPLHTYDPRDTVFRGVSMYVNDLATAQQVNDWPPSFIEALNTRQAIVSLNANPATLKELTPFFDSSAGCRILISHLGSPSAQASVPSIEEARAKLEPLIRLASRPNIGVKISGLYAMSEPSHDYPHRAAHPLLELARAEFGAERLYWGSDYSPSLEFVSFRQTFGALSYLGWPEKEMAAILGGNLARLLG